MDIFVFLFFFFCITYADDKKFRHVKEFRRFGDLFTFTDGISCYLKKTSKPEARRIAHEESDKKVRKWSRLPEGRSDLQYNMCAKVCSGQHGRKTPPENWHMTHSYQSYQAQMKPRTFLFE